MKSTQEIIGLRIINVADGTQVGNVKDIVLNPKGGTLDFFVIDQPSDYLGAKVISFSDVLGVGEFALTIPDLNVVQDVAQNSTVLHLLKQDIRVISTRVLTKRGELAGQVKELIIDEDTGKIAICKVESTNGEIEDLEASRVITYGKELLIVENSERKLAPSQFVPDKHEMSPILKVEEDMEKVMVTNEGPQDDAEFNLFEQRQLQYFVGKSVDKDITLDTGEILLAGEAMSEDTILKIKNRSTLMEITSHLRKQS